MEAGNESGKKRGREGKEECKKEIGDRCVINEAREKREGEMGR